MATSSRDVEKNSPPPEIVIPEEGARRKNSADHSCSSKNNTNGSSHRKMMTNLTKRPPAQIEYSELTYTVRERSGKWFGGVVPQTKQILHGKCSEKLNNVTKSATNQNFRRKWNYTTRRIDSHNGAFRRGQKHLNEHFSRLQNVKCQWRHPDKWQRTKLA